MTMLFRSRVASTALSALAFIAAPACSSSELTGVVSGELSPPVRVEAQLLDGAKYSLSDNRSPITVLSFWSPDSLASRKCIWELQRFASDYQDRGVATVAVSTLNDPAALRAFVAKRKLRLPVAMLGEHNLGALPDHQLPIVHVFDRDGKLLASRSGMYSYRLLEALVVPQLYRQ